MMAPLWRTSDPTSKDRPASIPFGLPERRKNLQRMADEELDAVVVGGGITGAATARDLALRGLRVGLVEMGDFASGTSSRSSKLVHGGLRYLENLDFALVFEALRERQILVRTAAHIVRPQRFLFPLYADDRTGPLRLRAGLILYDLLAGFRSIGRHRIHRLSEAPRLEPGLRRAGLRALASYFDAVTNDARLTLTVVRSAAVAGALAANYTRVVGVQGDASGRVIGVRAQDELSGHELHIRARTVVNATGVWASELLAMARESGSPTPRPELLHPSKGSHLIVDHRRLPVEQAIIFESPVDGRVMFVIPWGWFTVIGTTEVEFDGQPGEVRASPEEVAYLLESVAKPFPDAAIGPEDVCGTFSGLRPLVAAAELPAGKTSREHAIMDAPPGLFTVIGGKLTTERLMAEQTADGVVRYLKREYGSAARPCLTRTERLLGAPAPARVKAAVAEADDAARRLGLPDSTGPHLVRRHGEGWREILRRIQDDAALGELLAPPLPYTRAEAVFAAEAEMVGTLTDFMTHRTHLVYAGGADHDEVAGRAVRALAQPLGWSPETQEAQLRAYRAEREARLQPARSLRAD